MKNILLIGYTSYSENAHKMEAAQARCRAALGADTDETTVQYVHYDELLFELDSDRFDITDLRAGRPLSSYDFVLLTGGIPNMVYSYAVSRYLSACGVPFANDYTGFRPLHKLPQLIDMQAMGLPFPRTVCIHNKELFRRHVAERWQVPFILKANNASRGERNFLVRSLDQLERIFARYPLERFLLQEYIPNDSDYRILCMGKELRVVERFSRTGTHLTNEAQGGRIREAERSELPAVVLRQAQQLVRRLGFAVGGVDVIRHAQTGACYFLEANAQPGWPEIPGMAELLRGYLTDQLTRGET